MKPIPIALCINELEPGGAEKAIVSLACHLDRRRFTPIVYSLRSRAWHQHFMLIEKLESVEVPVRFLDATSIWSLPNVVNRLTKELRQNETQLIQSFLFHANMMGRIAARRAGVPVVCSGVRVAEKSARWHLWFDRFTSGRVDSYICVSDDVAHFTANRGAIPANKLLVIPNGVELSPDLTPTATELIRSKFPQWGEKNIIFAGRLTHQKGIDWLLETTPFWLADRPDRHLWIVGAGPLAEKLKKQCDSFPYRERIHFTGWRGDALELIAASDLVILPSRWEGMPNLLLEAMATGRPVLATQSEGVEQLLGEVSLPQTAPFGNTPQWTEKIIALLDNESRRLELGNANKQRVQTNFSPADRAADYENHWLKLLAKKIP